MMKIVGSYLKKIRKGIFLYFIFTSIYFITFMLYNVPTESVWYAFVLCSLAAVLFLSIDFGKYYRKYNKIEEMSRNITVHMEKDEKTEDLIESLYQEMLEKLYEERKKQNQKVVLQKRK